MKRITLTVTTIVCALAFTACDPKRKPRQKPAPGQKPEPTETVKPGTPTLDTGDKPSDTVTAPDLTEKPPRNPVPVPEPTVAPSNPEYAIKIEGKNGYVKSPYDPQGRLIDVRGLPAGTEAECPYTRRTFLVPP